IAACRQSIALADNRQVADKALIVLLIDLRADRHLERHVGTFAACHGATHTVHPGLCPEMLLIAIVHARVQPADARKPGFAGAPAIAAVGPAELDEFLSAKRHRPGTAVAGADIDLGLIEEFHEADTVALMLEWRPCSIANDRLARGATSRVPL